jgi:hypothetical protein
LDLEAQVHVSFIERKTQQSGRIPDPVLSEKTRIMELSIYAKKDIKEDPAFRIRKQRPSCNLLPSFVETPGRGMGFRFLHSANYSSNMGILVR